VRVGDLHCYDGQFMKLPNGEHAVVDVQKLRVYCLNPQHPRGRNKARVFAAVGIRQEDADDLRAALLAAARNADARVGVPSPYGQRYILDFDWLRANRAVRIRSTWMVRTGENLPRLTICIIAKKEDGSS